MIDVFSLERVNKAPASFDPKKLSAFQEHYVQEVPIGRKVELTLPFLRKAGLVATPAGDAAARTLTQLVGAAGDRIKVAGDVLDYADFFLPDDRLVYEDKAFDKRLRKPPEAAGLLTRFRERLAAAEAFDAGALETLLKGFVEAEGIEVGQIVHAVRVAVTGKAIGFGLFDTLAILGKPRCLDRIDRALARL
jgi:glutamyl-tRNA synthetase